MFRSLTTENIFHDEPNFLCELIILNSNLLVSEFYWKTNGKDWAKIVSCLKKINKDFNISYKKLGCYIYRCSVKKLNSKEFGKMAVLANKLIPTIDLSKIHEVYFNKINDLKKANQLISSYKQDKQKTLLEFLKELENE